jgi:hypothetical protein
MKDTNPTMEASNVEKGVFSVHVTTYNVGTDIVVDVSTPAGGDTLVVSSRKISAAAFAESYADGVDLVKECKLVCVRELFDAILISSTEDLDANSN